MSHSNILPATHYQHQHLKWRFSPSKKVMAVYQLEMLSGYFYGIINSIHGILITGISGHANVRASNTTPSMVVLVTSPAASKPRKNNMKNVKSHFYSEKWWKMASFYLWGCYYVYIYMWDTVSNTVDPVYTFCICFICIIYMYIFGIWPPAFLWVEDLNQLKLTILNQEWDIIYRKWNFETGYNGSYIAVVNWIYKVKRRVILTRI